MMVGRLGVRAWGIDASRAMIEQATDERCGELASSTARRRPAVPGRLVDAATMRLVVHLLGERRPAVFAELARVLRPEGRFFLWTFSHDHIDAFYLAPYLPSLPAIDRARFPPEEQLCQELEAAGFARTWRRRVDVDRRVERAWAAERLRAGYISTISLLDPAEVEAAAVRLDDEAAAVASPLRRPSAGPGRRRALTGPAATVLVRSATASTTSSPFKAVAREPGKELSHVPASVQRRRTRAPSARRWSE